MQQLALFGDPPETFLMHPRILGYQVWSGTYFPWPHSRITWRDWLPDALTLLARRQHESWDWHALVPVREARLT
jgi:hypothetical protein